MLSVLFFLQRKKEHKEKKIHKKTWKKYDTKNYSVSRYTLYTEQEHILRQHTDFHCSFFAHGLSWDKTNKI